MAETDRPPCRVSITLFAMSQTPNDPAGTTHQFQNFVNRAQPERSGPSIGLIVGIVVLVAIVAILAVAVSMIL